MKVTFRVILLITCFFISQRVSAQYEISGRLANYDSLWHNKIYLSYIDANDRFNHLSEKQIINSTTIDEQGFFVLKGINLPEFNSIVRIHLTKSDESFLLFSGDPINYLILVANNSSQIHIDAKNFSKHPLDYTVTGDFVKQNEEIKEFQNLAKTSTTINPFAHSEKSLEIISDNQAHIARSFCEKSKNPLVNAFALHNINLEKDYNRHTAFYDRFFKKNSIYESSYIKVLEREVEIIKYKYGKTNNSASYFVILVLILIILCLTAYIVYMRKRYAKLPPVGKKSNPKQLIELLTKREKEILELVAKEYQNKDIAQELHLGVSTIKTHLSKIYQKLGVKNRQESKRLYLSALGKD